MLKIPFAWLVLIASQPTEPVIIGDWSNPGHTVVVRIAWCGAALCGHVVQASEEARQGAVRGGTANLIGTEVLSQFMPAGAGRWKGWAFVPDKAIRTRARIVAKETDKLVLIGCDRTGVLCKKQKWRRIATGP